MAFDRWECRQCGTAVPADARFCPGCGLARYVDLLDPLAVETGPVSTTEGSPPSQRRGVIVTTAVIVAAVGLIWSVSRGGTERSDSDASQRPTESEAAGDTPATSASTSAPTTTERRDTSPSTTSERPGPALVADAPGPVFGPEVEGVVVATVSDTMHRIDLATGEITRSDLYWSLSAVEPASAVVIDGELVSTTLAGEAIIATDLATGLQREIAELEAADNQFSQIIGPAGPDSVWVTSRGYEGHSAVFEVELATGDVTAHLDLPGPFWAESGRGDEIYLTAPGGSWRYDTRERVAVDLDGDIVGANSEGVMLISCSPTLECEIRIETEAGTVPLLGVAPDDVATGAVQVGPGRSSLLVRRYDLSSNGALLHIDLTTGERTELGDVPIAPYRAALWVPGTSWVLGFDDSGSTDLIALDTESGEWFRIELSVGIDPPADGGMILMDRPD